MPALPYDRDSILDDARLGNEPSETYRERVDMLDNVVRECMHVSRSYTGIRSPTSQHFYASVLFTTLITRGVTLVNLAPFSPWSTKLIEHWDYASAAVIARTMLEIRLCFYYICVDPCSRIEWECRWNILNLHDCTARIKLFEAKGNDEQVRGFRVQADELRDRLRSNAHFLTIPSGRQNKYLNGQSPYMHSLEEVGARAGIELADFRWLYLFLSSHVHGLPMSFYRMGIPEGDGRGRGLPTPVEENYTSICLSLAASLLTRTRNEVHDMFREHIPSVEAPPETAATAEAQIESAASDSDAFPVGTAIDLVKTDSLRIKVERTAEDEIDVTYFHVPTDEVVLKRSQSETSGSALHWFDTAYWTVLVNGGPATQRLVADIDTKRIAFKVDPDTRTISLKMEITDFE